MKQQIWKFELSTHDKEIQMPFGAKILSVQMQGENICIWALVVPTNSTQPRYFEVYVTGHNIHCDIGIEREYLGTIKLDNDNLIFHIFERIN